MCVCPNITSKQSFNVSYSGIRGQLSGASHTEEDHIFLKDVLHAAREYNMEKL